MLIFSITIFFYFLYNFIFYVSESPIKKEHYLLQEVLDQDIIDKLQVLMEHGKPNVEIDVTAISKDNRRKIHKAIQSTFKETLYSNTKAIENKRFMVVSKTSTLCKYILIFTFIYISYSYIFI